MILFRAEAHSELGLSWNHHCRSWPSAPCFNPAQADGAYSDFLDTTKQELYRLYSQLLSWLYSQARTTERQNTIPLQNTLAEKQPPAAAPFYCYCTAITTATAATFTITTATTLLLLLQTFDKLALVLLLLPLLLLLLLLRLLLLLLILLLPLPLPLCYCRYYYYYYYYSWCSC
jgi:hypothetical protein